MRTLFYIIMFLLLGQSLCFAQQDCQVLKVVFKTEAEAIVQVEKSKFIYLDSLSGQFTDTLSDAKFYSCNKVSGFLILNVKGKKIIHGAIATRLWNNFKIAKSRDDFYNTYIRNNRYHQVIRK